MDVAHHFPQIKEGFVYLDSAATTLKPRIVVETLSTFYLEEYATIHRSVYSSAQVAGERYYKSRKGVADFLGAAHPEEIIFTRGTTHSLNLLATSFCATFIQEGDAIIISEIEHHSNVVPWQMAMQRHKGKLLYVRVDDRGQVDLIHLTELLQAHRVRLVSIAHVSNITGSVQPVEKIIAMGHAAGAFVALDGAQAVAHLEVDVTKLDVDFYAFSSHKIYGPTGVGVLYGKRALLEEMVPYEGGGDMIYEVRPESTLYAALPHKFEAGTPAIAEVIAFHQALSFVTEIGLSKVTAYENELRRYALKQLASLGAHFIGQSESSLITFTLPGWHPLDLASLLDCQGIALRSGHLCSQLAMARFSVQEVLRISFGIYSTKQDIDLFITAVNKSTLVCHKPVL